MKKVSPLFIIIYYLLQITWGIIQNALGFLIFVILTIINPKRERFIYYGAIASVWKFGFSCGCGMFIFYGHGNSEKGKAVLVHEYGHTIQSIILGPLFMLVIAIPSLIWAFTPYLINLRKRKNILYTDLYCEKWANKLGEEITGMPAPVL